MKAYLILADNNEIEYKSLNLIPNLPIKSNAQENIVIYCSRDKTPYQISLYKIAKA